MRRTWALWASGLALAGCTATTPTPAALHAPMTPSPTPSPSAPPSPTPTATSRPTATPALPVASEAVWWRGPSDVLVLHRPPAGPGQGSVTVMVLDQSRVRLVLHAGTVLPGEVVRSTAHRPVIGSAERSRLLAIVNGGFKISGARGGWFAAGQTAVPLVRGAASVVTYADGTTDIGAWGSEVPAAGRTVVTVRQNLQLLVDHGRATSVDPRTEAQLEREWGYTWKHAWLVSRSALGVTADGRLVWAAGTRVTPRALADALLSQGVVRALQLDINAPLVRGFLVRGGQLDPLVVGQTQGPYYPAGGATPHCTYLVTACPRDFFTVLAR